jgi:hypothetical protein
MTNFFLATAAGVLTTHVPDFLTVQIAEHKLRCNALYNTFPAIVNKRLL